MVNTTPFEFPFMIHPDRPFHWLLKFVFMFMHRVFNVYPTDRYITNVIDLVAVQFLLDQRGQ